MSDEESVTVSAVIPVHASCCYPCPCFVEAASKQCQSCQDPCHRLNLLNSWNRGIVGENGRDDCVSGWSVGMGCYRRVGIFSIFQEPNVEFIPRLMIQYDTRKRSSCSQGFRRNSNRGFTGNDKKILPAKRIRTVNIFFFGDLKWSLKGSRPLKQCTTSYWSRSAFDRALLFVLSSFILFEFL